MFSRNLENQNHKYEALSHKILAYLKEHRVKNCILDGEIVVFDTNQNKILTFQELQTTKQKAAGQEVSQGSTTHQHVGRHNIFFFGGCLDFSIGFALDLLHWLRSFERIQLHCAHGFWLLATILQAQLILNKFRTTKFHLGDNLLLRSCICLTWSCTGMMYCRRKV